MSVVRSLVVSAYLGLCLILGGASNGGFAANLILQVLALGMLVSAMWHRADQSLSRPARRLALLLVAAVALVALQFLPLPHALWELSGGRARLYAESIMAGGPPSPLLVALAPYEALASAVWALPALALGVAMLRWRAWQGEHLAWAIVSVMALSVGLGAAQLAGGPQAAAYFYAITNRDMTVGFFANSNHLASLLLVSLPFLAALVRNAARRSGPSRSAVHFAASGFALVAVVGLFANGSLAGYGLVLPVLLASGLILVPARVSRRLAPLVLVLAVAGGAALVLPSEELWPGLGEASTFAPGGRAVMWETTWRALRDFMPLGSGLGSFPETYHLYENPVLIEAAMVNHAHNDYLEVLLELGVPGGLLILTFLAWWGRRAVQVWRSGSTTPFAWAAMVSTATLMAHSIVDYPLRTAGLASVFIACCVIMAGWVKGDGLFLSRQRKPVD